MYQAIKNMNRAHKAALKAYERGDYKHAAIMQSHVQWWRDRAGLNDAEALHVLKTWQKRSRRAHMVTR